METTAHHPLLHKPSHPILIVEDIRENQILLENLCTMMGLPFQMAENGKDALKMVEEGPFSIFIVDLMLPVMDGQTFIRELKIRVPDAVILVQTALDDADTIIKVMKNGVFDYIIKPIDVELFQKVVQKSLEFYYLKTVEMQMSLNAGLKLRNQLEWLNYKETRRRSGENSAEILSIENLKTSLSQGAGVGSMVTLVDLMKTSLAPEGEHYKVSKELMDLLFKNNDYVRPMLDGLHTISEILQKDVPLSPSSTEELVAKIPSMIDSVTPYLPQKKLSISYPMSRVQHPLLLNMEKIQMALEEVLINAYKYSSEGGHIDIFTYASEGYFVISVKNNVPESPYGGIPTEFEKLVMEPFFRLLPPEESVAKIEKFTLGLGLTVVEHIARKHNGLFFIHDMKDHTGDRIQSCVVAEFLIPLQQAR